MAARATGKSVLARFPLGGIDAVKPTVEDCLEKAYLRKALTSDTQFDVGQ